MIYAFDIEVYRNFFSMVVVNVSTNQVYKFYSFGNRDDRSKIIRFLSTNPTLVGFNSAGYDVPVLNYYLKGGSLEDTHKFSTSIVEHKRFERRDREYYLMRDNHSIDNIDLMHVLSIDGMGVSLKQCGIFLKWKLLQELPIDPKATIQKNQVKILLDYNENDSLITKQVYLEAVNDIELRQFIENEYSVEVINCGESQIANELITQLYYRETGISPFIFKEQRTSRTIFPVSEAVGKNIKFTSKHMMNFFEDFKQLKLDTKNPLAIKQKVTIGFTDYQMGVGGLHSVDKPKVFEPSDNEIIMDADVSSFYPFIMLNNNIKPAHLDAKFLHILRRIVNQRIDYKKLGDALRAYTLKIVINSIFGKLGCETFWLYDLLAFYSVTISGQLYLLSLIDKLEASGIQVISANTDGVVAHFDKSRLDDYFQVCDNWQRETNFNLEFVQYDKYIRKDVNNYAARSCAEWESIDGKYKPKPKNKIKSKGSFEAITDLPFNFGVRKQYTMPIIPKAIKAYFFKGVPIADTINGADSIHEFLMVQKPGRKFQVLFKGKPAQRINRFYVSNEGGRLVKVDTTLTEEDKKIKQEAHNAFLEWLNEEPEELTFEISIRNELVQLANNIPDPHISNYQDLNREFYIKEARKIKDLIEPQTTKSTLF